MSPHALSPDVHVVAGEAGLVQLNAIKTVMCTYVSTYLHVLVHEIIYLHTFMTINSHVVFYKFTGKITTNNFLYFHYLLTNRLI